MDLRYLDALKHACAGCLAKRSDSNQKLEQLPETLPLWMHLTDTAGIMEFLFQNRVSDHEKELLREQTGSDCNSLKYFALSGFMHDLGKASSVFQASIHKGLPASALSTQIKLENLSAYSSGKQRHHSRMGEVIATKQGYPESFASLIGAHHGYSQPTSVYLYWDEILSRLEQYTDYYGNQNSERQWNQIWDNMSEAILKISGYDNTDEIPDLSPYLLMMVSGYLVEADWIASNESYFPLLSLRDEGQTAFYPERLQAGWKNIGLPAAHGFDSVVKNAADFQEMFGFEPNSFQTAVMETIRKTEQPGLLILEAPMGIGKTEAALAAAEIMGTKSKVSGIYFGLPTQATSNGLLTRFEHWSAKKSGTMPSAFKLAHSASSFNTQYASLRRGKVRIDDMEQETYDSSGNLFVHEWMRSSRLNLLSDYVIGTVDQGLLAALKQRFVMLRQSGLTGKVTIIDEVHSYSAYTNAFLDGLLVWLGRYKAPVVLISATLPAARKEQMIRSYLYGWNGLEEPELDLDLLNKSTYPGMIWTDGKYMGSKGTEQTAEAKKIQIKIEKYQSKDQEFKRITELLEETGKQKSCRAVIVNTVKKAQELYAYLIQNGYSPFLIHSRFTAGDRQKKEEELLRNAGKNSGSERDFLVIGTQVIEQSLDLDFDFIISELAPVDLLLQRAGRLHRHARSKRPDCLRKPVLSVMVPDADKLSFLAGSIYEDWLLQETFRNLNQEVEIPKDIPDLIEKVYQNPDARGITEDRLEVFKSFQVSQTTKRNQAAELVLRESEESWVNTGLDGMFDIAGILSKESEGYVRNTAPSFECILVQQIKNRILPFGYESDNDTAKADESVYMAGRIRIPVRRNDDISGIEKELKEQTWSFISDEQAGIFLRNEYLLLADLEGNIKFGSRNLIYSQETGLKESSL